MNPRSIRMRSGAALAALIALLDGAALAFEAAKSIRDSLSENTALPEAIYLFLRYFTILTNIGITLLMAATLVATLRGRALPAARLHAAALIYALVVCVTYEALLRATWAPQGVQFYTDMTMHDIVPVLTLVFWLAFAPKDGLGWRDPLLMLIYPTLYFAATLAFGAFGQGYPYDFLDVDRLGYPGVLRVALIFIAIFYGLGVSVTALARGRALRDTT